VVGYAAMGYYKSPLNGDEKKELLSLARQAITDRVTQGRITQYETKNPKFLTDGAVFVTIDIGGQLRGCIGQIRPSMPLYQSIIRNAQTASSADKRFIPMRPEELRQMELEISVISPLRPIESPNEIRIGRDGVYLVVEQATAVFLPSVAVEFRWSRERLMEELAKKAGLEPDAWRYGQLFVFEAEVFAEEPAK
jgi:AmmeMemoRadiSam system protein A